MYSIALILAAAWSAPGFGGVNIADMPIGFVTHYPFVEHQDNRVAATGATVMEIRAPWSDIEPAQGRWSFASIDRQLAWARANRLKLVYVLECGPVHAPGWVRRLVRIAGQETRDVNGFQRPDPSIFSPVYRKLTAEFIARCVGYLKAHDPDGTIVGYNNNCEWWYPIGEAYSPTDVATFRAWLRWRYGSLAKLGEAWDAKWASWDDVDAPRVTWLGLGGPDDLGELYPARQGLDTAWSTTEASHVAVEVGKEYTMRATVDLDGVGGAGAYLEVAWLGPTDPKPIASAICAGVHGTRRGVELVATGKAPPGAARAWLLMKFCGTGKAVYRKVSFTEAGSDRNLAPNPGLDPAKGDWAFSPFTVPDSLSLTKSWKAPGRVMTDYQPPKAGLGVGNGTAAIYDWTTFLQDSTADFIDWIAAQIKKADPMRPVITYLTYAFAQPFNWDYVFDNNIALDRVCERAAHQDVIGMQLAAADGDYHNVTCALDLARKYGKPMWAIDLLDYTSGVAIGERSLLRTSLSVVQHGGAGISYYCWYGTPDYNYSEMPAAHLRDMVETTKRVAGEVRGMRPVADVALVEPIMPSWTGLPEPANDFRDFMGWYKLLMASGLCPDVYTLHELKGADLSSYRLVVVPDCAYVSDAALRTLRAAAKAGVPVIAPASRFARRDMDGRERPAADRRWPEGAKVVEADLWGRSFLGPIKRVHKAGNTPPVFILEPGAPRYDGPDLGELAVALAKLGVTPTMRLTPADPRVEACELAGGGRSAVLLLNDGEKPTPGLTAEVGGRKADVGHVDLWARVLGGVSPR